MNFYGIKSHDPENSHFRDFLFSQNGIPGMFIFMPADSKDDLLRMGFSIADIHLDLFSNQRDLLHQLGLATWICRL
jgi:hypothetical protein